MDGFELFNTLKPGFLDHDWIRSIPPEEVYEEQVLYLKDFSENDVKLTCPDNITFGMYTGDMDKLRAAVAEVEKDWVQYFNDIREVYAATDGDKVVSFCLIDDFGSYKGMKVGGPGCVGTIPSCRKQGIGLKMVQNATKLLKDMGYDLSYIHYTGVGRWYEKLGYKTVVKWNCSGIISDK